MAKKESGDKPERKKPAPRSKKPTTSTSTPEKRTRKRLPVGDQKESEGTSAYIKKKPADTDGESKRSYKAEPTRGTTKKFGPKKTSEAPFKTSRRDEGDGEAPRRSFKDSDANDKRERSSYGRERPSSRPSYPKKSDTRDERPAKYGDEGPVRKSAKYDKGPGRDERPARFSKEEGDRGPRKTYGNKDGARPARAGRPTGDSPAGKGKTYGKPDREYGKPTKRSGTPDHSSGWKSEAELTKGTSHSAGAGKAQYRKLAGKTWKGKPVVEVRHTMRLNKYISNSGICSRREADNLIAQGMIEVNGKQITEMGYQVKESDRVTYAGERLNPEKPTYVLLNKPKDYLTTTKDPGEHKSVMMLLRRVGNVSLAPVGRLDRNTTGLLLFTNDGVMAKKLTHHLYGVKRLYHVQLDKTCKSTHIQAIKDGVELEDGMVKAIDVAYVADGKDKKQVGIELQSGKNNVVRRLFEHLGYNVIKLDRVVFAGLTKKDLPRGKWRHLSEQEVNTLKMM